MKPAPIDWTAVKERLRKAEKSLTLSDEDPRRLEEALRKRAALLAARRTTAAPAARLLSVMIFRLGAERYALPLSRLRQVLAFAHETPIPGAPRAVLAAIGARGRIRTVLDAAALLNLPAAESRTGGFVLMVGKDAGEIGLRVDSVEGTREIEGSRWQSPADCDGGPPARCLQGIAEDGLLVLDLDELLAAGGLSWTR